MKKHATFGFKFVLLALLTVLAGCTTLGLSEDLPPEILYERGDDALADGNIDRAEAFFQTAIECYPDDPGGYIGMAELKKGLLDFTTAAEYYQQAIASDAILADYKEEFESGGVWGSVWWDAAELLALIGERAAGMQMLEQAYALTGEESYLEQQVLDGRSLSLRGAWVNELTALERYPHIERLVLNTPNVTDYSPLHSLRNLKELAIINGKSNDLPFLSNLEQLEHLHLEDCQGADLSPLSNLVQLRYLRLTNCHITDLQPCAGLIMLEELYVDGNQITDLQPCSGLKKLEILYIGDNPRLFSLAGLEGMEQLTILDLSRLPVESFAPLRNCPLQIVYAYGLSNTELNALSDIVPNAVIYPRA